MNRGILIRLNGEQQSVPLISHDSSYYFDNDDDVMYRKSDARYDSIMGGWWVTYVEQKPIC